MAKQFMKREILPQNQNLKHKVEKLAGAIYTCCKN